MVYVTSGIRWAIVVWCAVAGALIIASAVQGVRPMAIGLIAVAAAVPLAVGTALTRFRPESRTAAQVLHDKTSQG